MEISLEPPYDVHAVLLNLTPIEEDLELYSGDGVSFTINVVDANGNPVNLTGTYLAQIRPMRSNQDPGGAIPITIDSSAASSGRLTISIAGSDISTVSPGIEDPWRGYWDIQWTSSVGGSQPLTLVQGRVQIDPDVSRP